MECPRCAADLDRYALEGREASVCDACGYIGVPVEHRGEYDPPESWDDAISRFHGVERVEWATKETVDAGSTAASRGGDDGTSGDEFSCPVCGETFHSLAAVNGHRASHADGEKEA